MLPARSPAHPRRLLRTPPLTVKVTDSSSPAQTQAATLTLTVNAAASAVSITTTLPAATENAAYYATTGSDGREWQLHLELDDAGERFFAEQFGTVDGHSHEHDDAVVRGEGDG